MKLNGLSTAFSIKCFCFLCGVLFYNKQNSKENRKFAQDKVNLFEEQLGILTQFMIIEFYLRS